MPARSDNAFRDCFHEAIHGPGILDAGAPEVESNVIYYDTTKTVSTVRVAAPILADVSLMRRPFFFSSP